MCKGPNQLPSQEVKAPKQSLDITENSKISSTCLSTNPDDKSESLEPTRNKYDWLEKNDDGFYCSICKKSGVSSGQANGAWVKIPIKTSTSRILYKKAAKHAAGSFHKLAIAANDMLKKSIGVAEQICTAVGARRTIENSCMKSVFRVAYYLFSSENAHTTNWRCLLSTVAACDTSGTLESFFRNLPSNAHHLSSTTATDILEAYGTAIVQNIKSRVKSIADYAVMADEATNCNGQEIISICIRFFENNQVKEVFIGCWPVVSTKAVVIHDAIITALNEFELDPSKLVAASFDGASNMSGQHGGVQALLRKHVPNLLFVHCRSHLLQLALVKASTTILPIKRVIGVLNKLYNFFQNSPLRLGVLKTVQYAVDGNTHKLVQSCNTRWLSNADSTHVIVQHYASILVSLESIYTDAGDLSSDAGGLMLTLRKPSTLFILTLLDEVLQPLARLSKCLQSSDGNISTAMSIANAVIASIEEINLEKIRNMAIETEKKVTTAGARMINNDDLPIKEQIKVCQNYINSIVTNLRLRFSDEVSSLCILEEILNKKPINPIFDKISSLLHVDSKELHSEWQILRRLPGNLNTQEAMMDLALSNDKQQMFPYFSAACRKILLLPLGTASVERSFSTMNRIMTSKRCRLNPDHLSQLMLLSIEGPDIPDIRDNDNSECAKFCELIDAAYSIWLNKPRRGFTNV